MSEQGEYQGFRSGRGGHRPGAGRKSGWNHTETQMIRVPKVFAQQLLEIAHRLDEREVMDSESESIDLSLIESIGQQVLADPAVTRQGKDSGAVRRAVRAFIELCLHENS
jgi:hypothetical protein